MKSNRMTHSASRPLAHVVAVMALSLSGAAQAHPGHDGGVHDLLTWGALAAGVGLCAAGAKQLKKIRARRGSR
jgi:hypothetical protein